MKSGEKVAACNIFMTQDLSTGETYFGGNVK